MLEARDIETTMTLTRTKNAFTLHLTPELSIDFQEAWVDYLRLLPFEEDCIYVRSTIYPGFSEKDKKTWNKVTVSNKELFEAVQSVGEWE